MRSSRADTITQQIGIYSTGKFKPRANQSVFRVPIIIWYLVKKQLQLGQDEPVQVIKFQNMSIFYIYYFTWILFLSPQLLYQNKEAQH
ncbi:unnamed protein product [Paramecium octaurelia]|uniref:Uncharacterized protein n=1 Tax=Paramecium octaurelia TaxID=43137 RepID=A0A8S1YS67_PAROT|nr:unnamed protein product [Paramecium octaurelia]